MKKRWMSMGAVPALVGTAMGLYSSVAHTKTTWQLVFSQPNSGNVLASIAAIDGHTAWALGVASQGTSSSAVGVRTTDGVTWIPFSLPMGTGPLDMYLFTEIAFNDAQNGWMAGPHIAGFNQENVVFRSDNGGNSWTEAHKPADLIWQLQALASGEMFGVGGMTLVRSTDGATVTETTIPVPGGLELRGVHMLNPSCGYVVARSTDDAASAQSAVLWSGDGGDSWEERGQVATARLSRLWFVSADLGWAAGTSDAGAGVVASTTDGGRSWNSVTMPDHPPPMGPDPVAVSECVDVRFFDPSRGVALCLACTGNCDSEEDDPSYVTVFLRTADGGQLWEMDPDYEGIMTAPPFGDMMRFSGMMDMAFPTPNAGFLAGQNNLVLRYAADVPEPDGWGPADCSPGGVGGGSVNPPAGGGGPGGPGAPGATGDDGGCGCRLAAPADRPAGPLSLAWLAALAWARRRRP